MGREKVVSEEADLQAKGARESNKFGRFAPLDLTLDRNFFPNEIPERNAVQNWQNAD